MFVTVPRRHTGDCERRRASTRRPSRLSAALHLADDLEASCLVPSSPSIPILGSLGVRSSRARRRSSRRPLLAAPPRFVAPRAAQPRRPPTPTTHARGRAPNRPKSCIRPPSTIEAPLRTPPLSSTTTFRPSSAPNRSPVSFPAACSCSSTFSPPKSAVAAAESPPRRRGTRCRLRAHAAGPPWAPPLAAAARPRAA